MNYNFTLSTEQQALVEGNLLVVDKVISRYIKVNENVSGLGWDDLYQEGQSHCARPHPPSTVHPPNSAPTLHPWFATTYIVTAKLYAPNRRNFLQSPCPLPPRRTTGPLPSQSRLFQILRNA